MLNALFFPVLFLITFALLIWIVIGCKGWWAAKFWLMNVSLLFTIIIWHSVSSYLGYPSKDILPDQFKLINFYSDEPKSIYIVTDEHENKKISFQYLFKYKSEDTIRLYKVNYNKDFHKKLELAMERVNAGAYVVVSKNKIYDAEELKRFSSLVEAENQFSTLGENHNSPLENYNMYTFPPAKFMKKPES